MMLNIAHRGASADAPENTLEAFELAIDQGADMIETDLHETRDGRIVLVHDAEVEGADVGKLTLDEVHARAPSIPTLEETLGRFGDRIPFNLEIKRGSDGDYASVVEIALDEVRRRRLLEQTLFSSFYDSSLQKIRDLEPRARIGVLVSRRAPRRVERRAERVGAEAVHPQLELATPERIAKLHAAGYRVHVFTVDDPADQERLVACGVDGLFTNVPARLRELLGGR